MSDELLDRELCTEGSCIGIIGPDGFRKECGRPGPSTSIDPRNQGLRPVEEVESTPAPALVESELPPAPDDFADRQLCPDGACIGVIGPDGRCSVCGRATITITGTEPG